MKENKREEGFLKKTLLGFFIGLAIIVPGVSGSAIAILFKLYDKILYAVANFRKEFRKSVLFLLPIGLGGIIGLAVGFLVLRQLLNRMPFAVISLFAGLMLGAIPSLREEIREEPGSGGKLVSAGIGLLIPVLLTCGSVWASVSSAVSENRLTVDFASVFRYVGLGFAVALTQLVPGCSATAVLMALGYFMPLMNALNIGYLKENPAVILVYVCLFIGFAVGCASFGRVLTALLKKYRGVMYYGFIGLSLGSVVCLFLNPDMLTVYRGWSGLPHPPFWDIALGAGLFLCGAAAAYEFILYMRRRNG